MFVSVSSVSDASILQNLNEGLAEYLLLVVGLFHGKPAYLHTEGF